MIYGVEHLGRWHPFFPLLPRHVEGVGWVCFEWVQRKGFYLHGNLTWLYRLPPTSYALA